MESYKNIPPMDESSSTIQRKSKKLEAHTPAPKGSKLGSKASYSKFMKK
jgi:hypothetical protein